MTTKSVDKLTIYAKEFTTNLKEILNYVGSTPAEIETEIKQAGLKIVSPQYWVYKGSDGNPDTNFRLMIGFPIEKPKTENENIKQLDDFKCISAIHNGAWSNLSEIYQQLMNEILSSGKKPSDECREIYHVVDFNNPENNVTEVQMGIL